MRLFFTLNLIKKCWTTAEQRVRELISSKYHAHDEVFITRLLIGEVNDEFDNINDNGTFEETFKRDLADVYCDPKLLDEVSRLSKGIIARIVYHEPQMEKISGADFGLVLIKPIFELSRDNRLLYTIHRRGLLCQAKRQKENGKMGKLTSRQIDVIPEHLRYFTILLYKYSDKDRHDLLPFTWWNDRFPDIDEIIGLLNDPTGEDTISSCDLIQLLGDGHIGTDDKDIINESICFEEMPYISVEITWRDGFPPKPPSGPNLGMSYDKNVYFGSSVLKKQYTRRNIHLTQVKHTKPKTR